MRKKVKGLLVPYLSWSLIGVVVGTPLVVTNNYICGCNLWERTVFEGGTAWSFVDATFGICRDSPKALGVLWFVRTLMVIFLFSPLWRIFARRSMAWVFILVFIYLYPNVHKMECKGFEVFIGTAPFFFIGIVAAVYLPRNWISAPANANEGCCFNKFVSAILSLSFWIYVTHNLFIQYITVGGHMLSKRGLVDVSFICPMAFLIAVLLSIASGLAVRKCFPNAFSFLNGGR